MFSWLEDSVNNAKKEVEKMVEESTGINPYSETEINSENEENPDKLHKPFLLPIQYLEERNIFHLSPIVSSDLELYKKTEDEKCVYQISMEPNHPFGKDLYLSLIHISEPTRRTPIS